MVVTDRMCYGKLLIEPQTHPIGSFVNKPTNGTLPSGLYATVLVAVLCSSDKDETDTDSNKEPFEGTDPESKLPPEDATSALISLGLMSLFLESSTIDLVRVINICTNVLIIILGEGDI